MEYMQYPVQPCDSYGYTSVNPDVDTLPSIPEQLPYEQALDVTVDTRLSTNQRGAPTEIKAKPISPFMKVSVACRSSQAVVLPLLSTGEVPPETVGSSALPHPF